MEIVVYLHRMRLVHWMGLGRFGDAEVVVYLHWMSLVHRMGLGRFGDMEIVVYLYRMSRGRIWSVRGICNVGLWVGVDVVGR